MRVAPNDEIYVSVPFGLSTTVSILWKSADGGRTFIPLGTPLLRDAITGPGGGDTHQDFDARGGSTTPTSPAPRRGSSPPAAGRRHRVFCLESAVSGGPAAAGPGATTSTAQSACGGGSLTQPLALPAGTLAIAAVAEASLPVPLELALIDPAGAVVETTRGAGVVVLERPVTQPGVYLLRALNLSLGAVEIWIVATPLVAREGAAP